MEGTQILNRTTESIARSHQISAETDQIGVETIDELGRQREVLVRTRDRVRLHEGILSMRLLKGDVKGDAHLGGC